jgi:hypothetical protein
VGGIACFGCHFLLKRFELEAYRVEVTAFTVFDRLVFAPVVSF